MVLIWFPIRGDPPSFHTASAVRERLPVMAQKGWIGFEFRGQPKGGTDWVLKIRMDFESDIVKEVDLMATNITTTSMRIYAAVLSLIAAGALKHAALWPKALPTAEMLTLIVNDIQARRQRVDEAREALSLANAELLNTSLHQKARDTYRTCRDTIRAIFPKQEADFGIQPREAPSVIRARLKPPENLRVTQVFSNGVHLRWRSVRGTSVYEVLLGKKSDPEQMGVAAITSLSSAKLEGLEPGNAYFVRVKAHRGKDSSLVGPALIVQLPAELESI